MTEQGMHDACRMSLDKDQRLLQGALKSCETVDAVLALVAQSGPELFNIRILTAALHRLALNKFKDRSAHQALPARSEFQRLLLLTRQEAPQMEGRALATVAWALVELQCADGPLFNAIEGEQLRVSLRP